MIVALMLTLGEDAVVMLRSFLSGILTIAIVVFVAGNAQAQENVALKPGLGRDIVELHHHLPLARLHHHELAVSRPQGLGSRGEQDGQDVWCANRANRY